MKFETKKFVGKPFHDFLSLHILDKLGSYNEKVLLGPAIGVDASVIFQDKLIAVHTDPITGASHDIGYFSIIISANDIASIGAKPEFASVCILVPVNSELRLIQEIQEQLHRASLELNIAIIGGHTEITNAVNKPIVITTMIGTLDLTFKERLKEINEIKKKPLKSKYYVVLINPIGIEATAIIANDFEHLISSILNKDELEQAKSLKYKISIVDIAKKAYETNAVLFAHDPTEGGIATALKEISIFLNKGMEIYEDKIIILDISKKIFNFLKIDPLKVISSGCLLCIVKEENLNKFISSFKNNSYISIIGELKNEKECIVNRINGERLDLLKIDIYEELWKLFD